jgi:hypothetical protein
MGNTASSSHSRSNSLTRGGNYPEYRFESTAFDQRQNFYDQMDPKNKTTRVMKHSESAYLHSGTQKRSNVNNQTVSYQVAIA